jgi:RNA recognition motif-containing protein
MRPPKSPGNLFVANVPKSYSDEQLAEVFDDYGIVIGARIARDPATGESRGYGWINIAPQTAAEQAIAALDGSDLGGRRIEVRVNEVTAQPARVTPVQAFRPPPPKPAARTFTVEYRRRPRIGPLT